MIDFNYRTYVCWISGLPNTKEEVLAWSYLIAATDFVREFKHYDYAEDFDVIVEENGQRYKVSISVELEPKIWVAGSEMIQ